MKTLDLHGIRHEDVQNEVENFILANPRPVKIITGNSLQMKQMVLEIIEIYDMKCMQPNSHNLAEYIVYD